MPGSRSIGLHGGGPVSHLPRNQVRIDEDAEACPGCRADVGRPALVGEQDCLGVDTQAIAGFLHRRCRRRPGPTSLRALPRCCLPSVTCVVQPLCVMGTAALVRMDTASYFAKSLLRVGIGRVPAHRDLEPVGLCQGQQQCDKSPFGSLGHTQTSHGTRATSQTRALLPEQERQGGFLRRFLGM